MNVVAPFDMVRQWWITTFRRFSTFPFILALIGIELYFYINGPAHFENWDSTYGQIIPVYIMMTVFFLIWAGAGTRRELKRPVRESAPWFVVFFIGTYFVMLVLVTIGLFQPGTPAPAALFFPTVIFQCCVVATSEELMFRGVILESTRSIIISAFLFSIWHSWAYGNIYYAGIFNIGALAFAFVVGIILAMIAKNKKFGLAAVIGVHACVNLVISGILITGVI